MAAIIQEVGKIERGLTASPSQNRNLPCRTDGKFNIVRSTPKESFNVLPCRIRKGRDGLMGVRVGRRGVVMFSTSVPLSVCLNSEVESLMGLAG